MIAVRHPMPARVAGLFVALAMALIAMIGVVSPVAAVESPLFAELSGANEVPGPGDPDGIGFADLLVDPDAGTLCVTIFVEDIAAASAAHVHAGATGVAGGVVVTLPTPDADGFADDCVTVDGALAQSIVDSPSDFYVNVHNAEFPDGAIRGQLAIPPQVAFAFLSGDAEVPGPGDPDGSGDALLTLDSDLDQICATIFVDGIATATAAHIHRGVEGVAGDVVVTLPTPDADGVADDCVAVGQALIDEIVADPAGFYVNVHNAEYPDGAVRGQLTGEPPAGGCLLVASTEDDPTPVEELTVTVGEEVVFLGVFQPDADVVLTLTRDGTVILQETFTADEFGFFLAVIVFEDGDEGTVTADAVVPDTECAGSVTLEVLGDGTPGQTPTPTATTSATPSPTPVAAELPDTAAGNTPSGALASIAALVLLASLASGARWRSSRRMR